MSTNIYNQWITKDSQILQKYAQDNSIWTIGVKDCIETQDFPTTSGTKALQGYEGNRDATVIKRLRDAGFKIAGKNNLHELCFGITSNNAFTGAVKNPHNTAHVAGGSSGGTAVAVAVNDVRAGVGTDTGGSSRIPAAFCGVYGFRPTTQRYDSMGMIPVSTSRDTAGPITQNLEDMCVMDAIMADKLNAYQGISAPQLSDVLLGIPDADSLGIMDEDVASLYQKALDKIESAGATLVPVSLKDIQDLVVQTSFPVSLYEVYPGLTQWLEHSGSGVLLDTLIAQISSPDVVGVLNAHMGEGAIPKDVYETGLHTALPALQKVYASLMNDNQLQAICWPTVPVLAPKIGEDETITVQGQTVPTFPTVIHNTDVASNVGVPSVSIPMGVGKNNVPAGLMLDGLENQDERLLVLAKSIDKII